MKKYIPQLITLFAALALLGATACGSGDGTYANDQSGTEANHNTERTGQAKLPLWQLIDDNLHRVTADRVSVVDDDGVEQGFFVPGPTSPQTHVVDGLPLNEDLWVLVTNPACWINGVLQDSCTFLGSDPEPFQAIFGGTAVPTDVDLLFRFGELGTVDDPITVFRAGGVQFRLVSSVGEDAAGCTGNGISCEDGEVCASVDGAGTGCYQECESTPCSGGTECTVVADEEGNSAEICL